MNARRRDEGEGAPFFSGFTPAAHRGASRDYPENTIEAFRRARDILPDCMIEIDVRLTADGAVVVFHDGSLERITDGRGPVSGMTLDEIGYLDAGYGITFDGGASFPFRGGGFRIPLLKDTLDAFPVGCFSIDIKDRDLEAAERVTAVIGHKEAAGRVIIGSFHERVVHFVREKRPGFRTSCSRNEIMRFLAMYRLGLGRIIRPSGDALMIPEFYGSGVSEQMGTRTPGFRVITEKLIREAHRLGIPVLAWTINRPENMMRLIDWGIDGIVTDHIELLRDVMAERGALNPGD